MSAALVTSVAQAIHSMRAMEAQGIFWDEDYRRESRLALANILTGRMEARVSAHLDECRKLGVVDRRNGSYTRHLLTSSGDLEIRVPRSRVFNPSALLRAYARRAPDVDRVILAAFTLGLSTRKVSETLLPILGEPVSAATVSKVAKQLDRDVAAFHRRRLSDRYRVVMFDGVVLARKTGAGALRRPVLVALGIRPDGKKEIIDFRQAPGESQAAWEAFLNDLYRRGLSGQHAEMVSSDGGSGLLAALPLVYPHLPVQRCWAHKNRNVLDKCKKIDRLKMKRDLHRIMDADGVRQARSAARRFAERWSEPYPDAVHCLRKDLDELLVFFRFAEPDWRLTARTTNPIERRFLEVKRRTRPMGVMADKTSIERILYAIFIRENRSQGIATPFPVTQNS